MFFHIVSKSDEDGRVGIKVYISDISNIFLMKEYQSFAENKIVTSVRA